MTPLESLIACGSKLWLDSIDPELIATNHAFGATGATSNPVIVSDLINTGRFDGEVDRLLAEGLPDDRIAWRMTDQLVRAAQEVFLPVWHSTRANDGYVSFELDPLLEDPESNLSHSDRVARYIELGQTWSRGHKNRMIKVPATPAGLDALEALSAGGVTLNVTLIFTAQQYRQARDAIWRGAQRRESLDCFKSVYSIFISRIDVYTAQHATPLSPEAQGQVGIATAKQLWQENQAFWRDKHLPLEQEIVFASTGTKNPDDVPWKYVQALAGSDILTNPPATNEAVQNSGIRFTRRVDQPVDSSVLDEIRTKVNVDHLYRVLMDEGVKKFADPQKKLLALLARKRAQLRG